MEQNQIKYCTLNSVTSRHITLNVDGAIIKCPNALNYSYETIVGHNIMYVCSINDTKFYLAPNDTSDIIAMGHPTGSSDADDNDNNSPIYKPLRERSPRLLCIKLNFNEPEPTSARLTNAHTQLRFAAASCTTFMYDINVTRSPLYEHWTNLMKNLIDAIDELDSCDMQIFDELCGGVTAASKS